MDTPKAIFFGLTLVALAIFVTDIMKPANAGNADRGRYMGVSTGDLTGIWVVDTETGAVRPCAATCGKWTK